MTGQPVLAFDVGGSFVKAGLVDARDGRVLRELDPAPTPSGATPEAVMDLLAAMTARLPSEGPVGLAFPVVAKRGVARTAANIDKRWIGIDAAALLASRIGRPVAFVNDADAAGRAEMEFGAGRGRDDVVMLLTLGTGIGSAVFAGRQLLPNTEFGHLLVGNEEAEHRASGRARIERELDWPAWSAAVNEVLAAYHALLWPDLFIIGGGVTENWPRFGHLLDSPATIVRARFGNEAGIVGAALAAAAIEVR